MFLSAIVLVTPPTEPDRAGVSRPVWLRPAITLYGDTTVLQVLFWPFFRAGKELNGGLTSGSKDRERSGFVGYVSIRGGYIMAKTW